MRAFICGVSGQVLTPAETTFLAAQDPWGVILFARNIDMPDQVRALVEAIRGALGRPDAPILIDQEGGRVQRLRSPHWREYPTAASLAEIFRQSAPDGLKAVALQSRLIAEELHDLGINIDCLPVLDVDTPKTHEIISSRTFGPDPAHVAALGRAAAGGLLGGGCLPVIKHIPGHGRGTADSHLSLPVVECGRNELKNRDFAPFKALASLPIAMTAHVLYTSLDKEKPATLSKRIITEVIRDFIGFDGLLLTDDLSMKALDDTLGNLTAQSIAAGCDIALHCNGDMAEMTEVAANAPELSGKALVRATLALKRLVPPESFDVAAAVAEFESLTGHKV